MYAIKYLTFSTNKSKLTKEIEKELNERKEKKRNNITAMTTTTHNSGRHQRSSMNIQKYKKEKKTKSYTHMQEMFTASNSQSLFRDVTVVPLIFCI